jgi:hypothetical protein
LEFILKVSRIANHLSILCTYLYGEYDWKLLIAIAFDANKGYSR